MAVNLSPSQFEERDLVESVEAAIAETGLDPARLELEITETVLLEESEKNLHILRDLQRLGVTIALDDFGTGYSSLSLLQRFAVDKIQDRSVVYARTTEGPRISSRAAGSRGVGPQPWHRHDGGGRGDGGATQLRQGGRLRRGAGVADGPACACG